MASYEIQWSDLTAEAQERLKGMYHENIELSPIAIVDIEDEDEPECSDCGSTDIEVFFDPDLSMHGESSCKCRDCGNTWQKD